MTASSGPPFGVCLDFAGDGVVVRLRGDVDSRTYADLGAVLDTVINGVKRDVVVHAPDLQFMDAHAVVLLSRVASAVNESGGRLVIRAPSAPAAWLASTAVGRIAEWQPADEEAAAQQAVRRVTTFPADREVLRSALRLVVELAEAIVEGADVATISLARHRRLQDVISRNSDIAVLDHEQYTLGEGPCLEAAEERQPMHVTATGAEQRWPTFMSRARDLGVKSMLSTPLRRAEGAFGALNLYAFRDRAFPSRAHELAGSLAERAARVLDAADPYVRAEDVAERLRSALETRQSIALAQGVLAEREGVSPMAAYTCLRRTSEQTSRPLSHVARDIVASLVSEPHAPVHEGRTDGEPPD